MTVTNVCLLAMASTDVSSEFLDQVDQMLNSQDAFIDDWAAKNKPSNFSFSPHRGLVVFQQVEDPKILLGSSQFPSQDLFDGWMAGGGEQLFRDFEPHHHFDQMDSSLVEGEVFPDIGSDHAPTLFSSSVVEFTRWRVPVDQQDSFDSAVKALERHRKETYPGRPLFSGWRLDACPKRPELKNTTEYYMFTSCEDNVEPVSDEGLTSKEEAGCKSLSVSVTRRHYKKAM